MNFRVVGASLASEWQDFIECLPGWTRLDESHFSGGGHIQIDPVSKQTSATIVMPTGHAVSASPQGLQAIGRPNRIASADQSAPARLNHVAIDAPFDDTDLVRLFTSDDPERFLPRAERFDPAAGANVTAEHVVSPFGDYLTIRYLPGVASPRLSHLGFQFETLAEFNTHCSIVEQIGWPIVIGPEEIDGSMVLHFKGPDGLIHDLFYVLR